MRICWAIFSAGLKVVLFRSPAGVAMKLYIVSGLLPPKSSVTSGVSSLPHKARMGATMRPSGSSETRRTKSR